MLRGKSGFTLIELLFAVLVLGIVTGIALFRPGFDFTIKSKARTTAQRLVSDLRLTRRLAITNSEQHTLIVYPSEDEYKIFDSGNSQVGDTRTIDSDTTLSGDTEFVFESLGNISRGSSLLVSVGANQYNISIVSATGMVSMQEQ